MMQMMGGELSLASNNINECCWQAAAVGEVIWWSSDQLFTSCSIVDLRICLMLCQTTFSFCYLYILTPTSPQKPLAFITSIIIMFYSRNKPLLPFTNTTTTFIHQTSTQGQKHPSMKRGDLFEEGVVGVGNKILFEQQCKKEIKHFLNGLTKSQWEKQIQGSLFSVAKLFLWTSKQQKLKLLSNCSLTSSSQKTTKNGSQIICLINKTKSIHNYMILIVSFRLSKQISQQITFDVQIISVEGKMAYKKIGLSNWQEIYFQVEKAKNNYCKIIPFINNKQLLIKYTPQQLQLHSFIHPFHDLHTYSRNHPLQLFQQTLCDKQQIITSKDLYQVIEKYKFIMGWLEKRSIKTYIDFNFKQLFVITLAYNIISKMNVSTENSMERQIQNYRHVVISALETEFQNYKGRSKSGKVNLKHYPGHLVNAHNCRMCGKRGYVCCSTCKQVQGRQIPLCLYCYQPYHQQLNHPQGSGLLKMARWDNINNEVQLLLQGEMMLKEQK